MTKNILEWIKHTECIGTGVVWVGTYPNKPWRLFVRWSVHLLITRNISLSSAYALTFQRRYKPCINQTDTLLKELFQLSHSALQEVSQPLGAIIETENPLGPKFRSPWMVNQVTWRARWFVTQNRLGTVWKKWQALSKHMWQVTEPSVYHTEACL